MLVDNKFIFINLPRCGSTSFYVSCKLYNLEIEHLYPIYENLNVTVEIKDVDENQIMDFITHGHDDLVSLRKKFGKNYPVIAVKRDRYETFYSLFKHIIWDLRRAFAIKPALFLKNCSLDELFFFKKEDLSSYENRLDVINEFLLKNNFIKKYSKPTAFMQLHSDEYIVNVFNLLLTPSSYWHNHDKDIIWFDIDKLDLMENWVSNKIGKEFKLKHLNSTQNIECSIQLDQNFKDRYDTIYNHYDIPKISFTLI